MRRDIVQPKVALFSLIIGIALTQSGCFTAFDPFTTYRAIKGAKERGTIGGKRAKRGCATKSDFSTQSQNLIFQKSIDLRRETQAFEKRNCDGKIISKPGETWVAVEPQATVKIETNLALQDYPNGLFVTRLYNRTTCNESSEGQTFLDSLFSALVTTTKAELFEFYVVVNASPTLLQLHVQRGGLNAIDFDISTCESAPPPNKSCEKYVPVKNGHLLLTVNYSEGHRPGVREVVDCPRTE